LVAITDVHLGYGTGVDALKGFVDQINQQSPDVVLIVGDLIDNSLKPLFHDSFDKVLSMIKAPQGIYMVPGNHEYISGIDDVADYLRGTSIVLLRDSVVTLSNGIQIVGRDDRMNKKRKPLKELLVHTNEKHPIIVLDHQPYNLNITDSLKVDLQISGHTHHGQLFPFNLLTDYLYEQSHGYRKWKNSHIWVSSGLSLWGPPFRIGTKGDFAIIDIMHAANVSVE
jgi:predicted MPP superfamily phosphohydrolase